MKSLITGGAGFIGSHLCEKLIELGSSVVCVDNLLLGKRAHIESLLGHPQFNFIEADICDDDVFEKIVETHPIDTIFHLAANSDIQAGSKDISRDMSLTLQTTVSCLKAAKAFDVKSFVFASSSAVYGRCNKAMSEIDGPCRPVSFYGAAKLASENFIHAMCEQTDLKTWIFRFPNVIGPRLTHGVIYDFLHKLKKNPSRLEIWGDGNQTKPYMLVSDLIEGMLISIRKEKDTFNVVNIGVESSTTVTDIADMVIKEMGLRNVNKIFTGGESGWVGDVPRFEYDCAKIHQMGWQASMSSDEAVRTCIQHELKRYHMLK